jgi:hypothetical protein
MRTGDRLGRARAPLRVQGARRETLDALNAAFRAAMAIWRPKPIAETV